MLLLWCAAPLVADDSAPQFRFTDRVIGEAMSRGTARSPAFRKLLRALAASDLIVYIERHARAGRPSGFTQFLAGTAQRRYIRIVLEAEQLDDGLVGLLGHELRHAVEIAESPLVMDQKTYGALYHTIGRPSCGPPRWCFDTDAAVIAGYRVIEELARDELLPIAEVAGGAEF